MNYLLEMHYEFKNRFKPHINLLMESINNYIPPNHGLL